MCIRDRALERHLPSLVLLLSSHRGLVARARLWITARRLWNDTRLHSFSCPVSAALWLELGSGSQHGGFGATPAFTPPLAQSARPCGSSSALDHSTEALERHPPHSSSSCPVSAALWLELGSGSQHGGLGATPAFTRPPHVQSARHCGSSSALDHSTEALQRHPPSLVLLLSSQRGLVARTRL